MDSYLPLTLTIFLMFARGHCYSESMSCSTVNGKMVCERQRGNGNTAGAFSGAFSGPDGAYQDATAMAGSTLTGQSQSSRTVVDGQTFRGSGVPNFYPNTNSGRMHGSGHLIGSGASEATSLRANTGHAGISTNGFAGTSNNNGFPGPEATSLRSNTGHAGISTTGFDGTSNNNGFPGPAFGGFAVADLSGNSFYGGGNPYGGGYTHGYGNPNAFDAVNNVLSNSGMRAGFPFNTFGRRR